MKPRSPERNPDERLTPVEVGQMLIRCRERLGLARSEVAQLADVDYDTLLAWECGRHLETATRILSLFWQLDHALKPMQPIRRRGGS